MVEIRSAARALGGDVAGPGRILCPGPGHSKRDRSLSVTIDTNAPAGFAVHSFAGDDWQECKDHVRGLLGIPFEALHPETKNEICRKLAELPKSDKSAVDTASRREYALALWQEAGTIGGTPAEIYLRNRGIDLPDDVVDLRFLASCPFAKERHPAMIALMRSITTDEPQAIHRAAIKPDGSGKAVMADGGNPKRMLGPSAGAAIKLIPDAHVSLGLGLAEGIENALTVMCGGWRPVWAAGSAGAISSFPVLPGISAITVFADPEPAGMKAARQCGVRWQEAGKEATIIRPPSEADWNEVAA